MALNALQRLDLEDRLISLISRCINLDHPQKPRMCEVTFRMAEAFTDDQLVAMSERLAAWITEHESSALAAPAEVG